MRTIAKERSFDGRAGTGRAGFTLLELLTVVVIMIILMTLAAASYRGMMQGSAMAGAVSNLRATISLARQFAVTHRGHSYVMFQQDAQGAHYLVCGQDGQHAGTETAPILQAEGPRWDPNTLVGATIYNLTADKHGTVTENTHDQIKATSSSGGSLMWAPGDKCGWVIRDQQHLPDGLGFGPTSGTPLNPDDTPQNVIFKPDGSTPLAGNGNYTIRVKEASGNQRRWIRIKGLTGMIQDGDGAPP